LECLGYGNLTDFTDYLYENRGAIPCLIPPDREKKFFYETSFGIECRKFWDGLWTQATDAAKLSQRLVLCGYSLLPVDKRACDLLLNEPGKETHITVISGGEFAFGIAQSRHREAYERWLHRMLDRCTVLDSASTVNAGGNTPWQGRRGT
jgi:hypothetical protein